MDTKWTSALCGRRKSRLREVQQPAQGYSAHRADAELGFSAFLSCPFFLPEHFLGSRTIASAVIPESPEALAFPFECGSNKTIATKWAGFPGANGEGRWGDVLNGGDVSLSTDCLAQGQAGSEGLGSLITWGSP